MPIFKFNKNKISSAASTPAQTPISSIQLTHPHKPQLLSPEQALNKTVKRYGFTPTINL
ncbi:hypothetical protein BGZ76_011151, partial [Entomortierella beljakovae]